MPEPRWHLHPTADEPVTTASALEGAWQQQDRLQPGLPVQVRSRFDGRWVSGFEVVDEADTQAYEIRRRSDHAVLPERFPRTQLRPERLA